MKSLLTLIAVTLTLFFSGCSSSSSSESPPSTTLQSIEISPPTTTLNVGTTERFTAIGFYSNKTQVDITDTAIWSLESNSGIIAPVSDSLSHAQAIQVGTDKIVATLGSVKNSADVIATDNITLVTLQIIPQDANIVLGTGVEFKAEGNYSNGQTQDLTLEATWISNDSDIAEISNRTPFDVWVDAVSEGDTTVEVSYEGITTAATVSVWAENKVESIKVEPASWSTVEGDSRYFTTIAIFSDGSEEIVNPPNMAYILYNDSGIVKIDNNLIHAINEGNETVTASYLGHQADISVEVVKLEIENTTISPVNYEVIVGQQRGYLTDVWTNNGQGMTLDNSNINLTYSSSNEAVAVISNIDTQEGLLTGKSTGIATITSTFEYDGETYESNTTVTIVEN